MNWLRDLKISTKLFLSFGIVLAVTAALGVKAPQPHDSMSSLIVAVIAPAALLSLVVAIMVSQSCRRRHERQRVAGVLT